MKRGLQPKGHLQGSWGLHCLSRSFSGPRRHQTHPWRWPGGAQLLPGTKPGCRPQALCPPHLWVPLSAHSSLLSCTSEVPAAPQGLGMRLFPVDSAWGSVGQWPSTGLVRDSRRKPRSSGRDCSRCAAHKVTRKMRLRPGRPSLASSRWKLQSVEAAAGSLGEQS